MVIRVSVSRAINPGTALTERRMIKLTRIDYNSVYKHGNEVLTSNTTNRCRFKPFVTGRELTSENKLTKDHTLRKYLNLKLVGLIERIPQNAAGMRMLPPISLPTP